AGETAHPLPLPHTHELTGHPSEPPLSGEPAADLGRLARDRRGVLGVRREAAADVALAGGAAEDLVVRREKLDNPQRRDPQLHARASEVRPDDQLLDDAAPLAEPGDVGLVVQAGQLELQLPQALPDLLALPRRPRLRPALQ